MQAFNEHFSKHQCALKVFNMIVDCAIVRLNSPQQGDADLDAIAVWLKSPPEDQSMSESSLVAQSRLEFNRARLLVHRLSTDARLPVPQQSFNHSMGIEWSELRESELSPVLASYKPESLVVEPKLEQTAAATAAAIVAASRPVSRSALPNIKPSKAGTVNASPVSKKHALATKETESTPSVQTFDLYSQICAVVQYLSLALQNSVKAKALDVSVNIATCIFNTVNRFRLTSDHVALFSVSVQNPLPHETQHIAPIMTSILQSLIALIKQFKSHTNDRVQLKDYASSLLHAHTRILTPLDASGKAVSLSVKDQSFVESLHDSAIIPLVTLCLQTLHHTQCHAQLIDFAMHYSALTSFSHFTLHCAYVSFSLSSLRQMQQQQSVQIMQSLQLAETEFARAEQLSVHTREAHLSQRNKREEDDRLSSLRLKFQSHRDGLMKQHQSTLQSLSKLDSQIAQTRQATVAAKAQLPVYVDTLLSARSRLRAFYEQPDSITESRPSTQQKRLLNNGSTTDRSIMSTLDSLTTEMSTVTISAFTDVKSSIRLLKKQREKQLLVIQRLYDKCMQQARDASNSNTQSPYANQHRNLNATLLPSIVIELSDLQATLNMNDKALLSLFGCN